MCGFVGFLAFNRDAVPGNAWVQQLINSIAHRGPDDQGVLITAPVALGFRRLSILDLSPAGHQPMTADDGQLAMVFNGEIYNYIELRKELEALGHRIRSSGDSEVLLAAYRQWGERCVDRFVGMFAFCIVDHRAGKVFVARDRFGIKPLYFLRHESGVLFASELKAIRRSGLWRGNLNNERFSQFLAFGRTESVPEDRDTYLEGVHQILPGHSCALRFDGHETHEKYWEPNAERHELRGDPVPAFLDAFDDSIRLHMRADVPVGVMLSGGMDSVSIACAMSGLMGFPPDRQELHAFSYLADEADESVQLRDTIAHTGAISHSFGEIDAHSFWSRLEELIWYHDEPVHSPSVLMGFELYRLAAASGIRVVMSGQGADETLGGYPYLFEHMLVTEAVHGRLPSLMRQVNEIAIDTCQARSTVLQRVARMMRSHVFSRFGPFRRVSAARRLRAGAGRPYVQRAFLESAPAALEEPSGQTLPDALRRAIASSPLPHYLRAEDRNSMANSVESRVPFLDHRLVELASRLPAHWMMSDGWNKRILREAMVDRIPDSVRLRRTKFGFPTSANRWFAGALALGFREIIADGPAMQSGWFDKVEVGRAFERHVKGEIDASNMIFNVAQIDCWLQWHKNDWVRNDPVHAGRSFSDASALAAHPSHA